MSRAVHRLRGAIIAATVIGLSACGADDTGGGSEPGVIDSGAIDAAAIDGSWELLAGQDVDGELQITEESDEPLVLQIDVTAASVRMTDQCQTVFGSLSATADGASTFTIPGSTTAPCDGPLETEHLRAVAALEAVTSWEAAPGQESTTLELRGPDETLLTFRPVG